MGRRADGEGARAGGEIRMRCRGIRGATTVAGNTREAILASTRELLTLMAERNALDTEEITSVFFTVSEDLDAEHPALAARQLGWTDVALLCAREIPVPGGLGRCVRVLLHVNTTRSQAEIRHVYLHDAVVLRPGWADASDGDRSAQADEQAGEQTGEQIKNQSQGRATAPHKSVSGGER